MLVWLDAQPGSGGIGLGACLLPCESEGRGEASVGQIEGRLPVRPRSEGSRRGEQQGAGAFAEGDGFSFADLDRSSGHALGQRTGWSLVFKDRAWAATNGGAALPSAVLAADLIPTAC